MYIVEKAKEYNRDVDKTNNLWFRFDKKDRSVYYIDIDSYITKVN